MPVKIFFCYARKDEPLLNKLKSHLRPLRHQGLIDIWHDHDISAGKEWEREIDAQLNSAQIILLLVSPDFMDSDYCYSTEMQLAMKRHESGEARVIPIILRPTDWRVAPLNKLQALPDDAKPVTNWANRDQALLNIAQGLRKVIEETLEKATDIKNVGDLTKVISPQSPFSATTLTSKEDIKDFYPRPIPDPIQKYLESYPMFNIAQDIGNLFVRTSPESFYHAAQIIYQSLTSNQVVWVIDNLNFSPDTNGWFTQYWVGEGLEHLRINYEASSRGIIINRIFLITTTEYAFFKHFIDEIGILHTKAGVVPHVALYEKIPPQCRYDFAIWGDIFVDEVIFDIRSNSIIDNHIHWSPHKMGQFKQKMSIIRNLIESDWVVTAKREDEFQNILTYAGKIRELLKTLNNPSAI